MTSLGIESKAQSVGSSAILTQSCMCGCRMQRSADGCAVQSRITLLLAAANAYLSCAVSLAAVESKMHQLSASNNSGSSNSSVAWARRTGSMQRLQRQCNAAVQLHGAGHRLDCQPQVAVRPLIALLWPLAGRQPPHSGLQHKLRPVTSSVTSAHIHCWRQVRRLHSEPSRVPDAHRCAPATAVYALCSSS